MINKKQLPLQVDDLNRRGLDERSWSNKFKQKESNQEKLTLSKKQTIFYGRKFPLTNNNNCLVIITIIIIQILSNNCKINNCLKNQNENLNSVTPIQTKIYHKKSSIPSIQNNDIIYDNNNNGLLSGNVMEKIALPLQRRNSINNNNNFSPEGVSNLNLNSKLNLNLNSNKFKLLNVNNLLNKKEVNRKSKQINGDDNLVRYAEMSVPVSERKSSLLQFNNQPAKSISSLLFDLNKKSPISTTNNMLNVIPIDGGTESVSKLKKKSSKIFQPITFLPNGPPPFRPSNLLLLLYKNYFNMFEKTITFKKLYKSKVYYLFLDTLRQLTLIVDKLTKKQIDLSRAKLLTIQAVFNKFIWKGGHMMKLKWPLVMLNPKFLREILSNPTFLVMLFHGIEVAHASMPPLKGFWLKPLVKMVAQRSPEEEEQIWWRRKRFYDSIHGHGASELEPNLKTKHFIKKGKQVLVSFPVIGKLINNLTPSDATGVDYSYNINNKHAQSNKNIQQQQQQQQQVPFEENSNDLDPVQEEAFLANQLKQQEVDDYANRENNQQNYYHQVPQQQILMMANGGGDNNQEDWLLQLPTKEELMSQEEFESLDSKDKEIILQEAKRRFEESKWANDIIKQHSDFVESFKNNNYRQRQNYNINNSLQSFDDNQFKIVDQIPKKVENKSDHYKPNNNIDNSDEVLEYTESKSNLLTI